MACTAKACTALSFFVMLDAIRALLYTFVVRFVEKRLDISSLQAIGRAMLLITERNPRDLRHA